MQNNEVVEAITDLIRAMVDHPEVVDVQPVHSQQASVLETRVLPGDTGQVIGRAGRSVQAIRELLVAISGAQSRHFSLELLEPNSRRPLAHPAELPPRPRCNLATPRFEDDPVQSTERILTKLVRLVVDEEQETSITRVQGHQVVIFEVTAAPEDTAKVIGTDGRVAMALRTLVSNLGRRAKRRYLLEIVEPKRMSSRIDTRQEQNGLQ